MKLSVHVFLMAVAVTTMSAAAAAQRLPSQPRADIIFLNANIYTGVETSSFHAIERAEALAVHDGRVEAVGRHDEIMKLKGPSTEVVDLGGHFVMPGFNDAHVHLANAGFQRLTVDLVGVKSLTEFRDRIRTRVQNAASNEWIVGGGWDQTLWPVKELPSRWDIDEVTRDHPVFLERVDGHIAVANTRALQLAGITVASKDPLGGKIDRDTTGQATGVVRETARQAVTAVIPKPNHDRRRQAIEAGLQELARSGVTSVQDNSDYQDSKLSWDDFQIFALWSNSARCTTPVLPNCLNHAYRLCVVTPSRSATSATLNPRSVTCLTASTLNSSVYRLLLIDTSDKTIFHGLEMSRKPWAIHSSNFPSFQNAYKNQFLVFPKTPSSFQVVNRSGTVHVRPSAEKRTA